jgi:two-component system, cell cycle sensor histidine kinase and response regulator CckA
VRLSGVGAGGSIRAGLLGAPALRGAWTGAASWLPLAVGVVGLGAVVLLWQSLLALERRQVFLLASAQARSAARDLQQVMQSQVGAFSRLTQLHGVRLRDNAPFQIELGGLTATSWVDPSGVVRRVFPPEPGRDLVGVDLTASDPDRSALLEARQRGQPVATRSIPMPRGDSEFHVVVPVSQGAEFQGFVVGDFSESTIYSVLLPAESTHGWAMAVFEGDRELYRVGSPVGGAWLAESPVALLGSQRRLRVGARPEVLAPLRSSLPRVVLATGSIIALLLAASFRLAQSARQRARHAEAAEATLRASEFRFRNILDSALDAVVMMDSGGLIVSWNRRAEALFGWARDEVVGRPLSELIIPGRYREAHTRGLARFLATGEGPVIGRRIELSALRRDGSEFPIELTVTVLEQDGRFLFNAFVADITERRRAQQRLAARHVATRVLANAETLAEAAPRMLKAVGEALGWDVGALWTVDADRAVMRCRELWRPSPDTVPTFTAAAEGLELPRGRGLPGRVWLREEVLWIPDLSSETNLPRLAAARQDGLQSAFAFPIRLRGEVVGVVEFFSRERRERDPELDRIMADLASQVEHFWRRRRAEKALHAAQDRLAHLVASSPAVLYSLTVEGGALATPAWVSENVEQLLGYTPEEVLAADWWGARVHPEDRERVLREEAVLLAGGHVTHEYRFRHKEGGYRWLRAEVRLVRDATGHAVEAVGSWSDITSRKEAELKLKESEEQYRLLFESNPQPMWVYDDETLAFLAVNDAAVRHYGYSRGEFLALTLRDIRPPEEVPAFDALLARRRQEKGRQAFHSPRLWKHRTKDGALIDVEITSSPLEFRGRRGWLAMATDVTDKKRLEAQLLQSQKMESVGRLAGGVAHDFNNLLGVITGYGDLLQREIGPRHPAFGRVEEIRKAADRAAALTRQLLAFSRKQVLEPKVLDLNAVVVDTEKMLRRLIGEDIHLITAFGEGLGRVKADRSQLEQVIVNLAVNARDAMPKGGKLIIETADVELDEGYARGRPDARAGPHVMLAISDTGHGMSAETLSHLFEPFFTTKEQGKGTGLGLATVYGIVRQTGGHVMVYSELGQGTTFKVYLPRIEDAREPEAESVASEATPSGTETILLVEDEASLRVLIREILESAEYDVLEGPTPEEALATAGGHPAPIHLVLTDVVLPRMSGRQMAEALRSSRPEARVLFMSGYTDDAISHHGILEPGVYFLQKPFTTDALLRKVREVLDAPDGTAGRAN